VGHDADVAGLLERYDACHGSIAEAGAYQR
jgi:hypothetical protein